MKLIKLKNENVKCDLGICENIAEFCITNDNVTIENRLNICKDCIEKLKKTLSKKVQ